eukprot:m.130673 g.130673  ORF g.130673 m.130673 type:complete len:73 (-) comp29495_c0_seq3:190-408(-)
MQSVELARSLPHATHYCDPFSSHASLLENPERHLPEIEHFLNDHGYGTVAALTRNNSTTFVPSDFGGLNKND